MYLCKEDRDKGHCFSGFENLLVYLVCFSQNAKHTD